MRKSRDALARWLSISWERREPSYDPDVRDFVADLLGYPRENVHTQVTSGSGYADFVLLSPEKVPWAVGEFRRDDMWLTDQSCYAELWKDKSKYVTGSTRYMLFLTAHYLRVVRADGSASPAGPEPTDLRYIGLDELEKRLAFVSYARGHHEVQWREFIEGQFPYSYLKLDDAAVVERLRADLQSSFEELVREAHSAIRAAWDRYENYLSKRERVLKAAIRQEVQEQALARLKAEYAFECGLFEEAFSIFERQYGREVNGEEEQVRKRVLEAFVADSVAALIARVLFIRLVEDLGLSGKRWISNGGPQNWAAFVSQLAGDARVLLKVVGLDVGRVYREPFGASVFDWLQEADSELDLALQRLILKLNAYDFSTLSEEVLGEIYQQFLPAEKRKQLGEYYTPSSVVDWLLEQTVWRHRTGTLLDPACGSGSFLVRYVHRLFEDGKRRGLDLDEVSERLQDEVWGFDLNPFAAFVSHFQLLWAHLRHASNKRVPEVRVFNLNSLLKDEDMLVVMDEQSLPPGCVARDKNRWSYVVGNPPYIRAERVKYGNEMQRLWSAVWGQNADTGLVFLYRSLTEWLDAGGYLGMVVSGGYASSEAAVKVWQLLEPDRTAALRKLVWLEFAGKVWEPAVIPMLLVVEKVPARPDDEIELFVPSSWPSAEEPVRVRYADFFDSRVNPAIGDGNRPYGHVLLPLLRPADVPILRKLAPGASGVVALGEAVMRWRDRRGQQVCWTYGIQRGGAPVTETPQGSPSVAVLTGQGFSVAWAGKPVGWVNLAEVARRPNGKLSLWRDHVGPREYIGVPEIGLALSAAVVRCEEGGQPIAALGTVLVAVPKPGGPPAECVAAVLNSELVRYCWCLKFRAGVLAGSSRAHVYPRALEALPWPLDLPEESQNELRLLYGELERLAEAAKDNPKEWLLNEVELRKGDSVYLSDPSLGLDFRGWLGEPVVVDLILDGACIRGFDAQLDFGSNAALAELTYVLVSTLPEEEKVSRAMLQRLRVPRDYRSLMDEYWRRAIQFKKVQECLMRVLQEIDRVVYDLFGLSEDERCYVHERMSSFPLDRLVPRYPWDPVRIRPVRAYVDDRFR